MEYTITIPKGSAIEFLKCLTSQCLPYEQRPYLIPDGKLYGSFSGQQFLLYTAGPRHESYLEGCADDAGTVSFTFSAPKSAKIVHLTYNGAMLFCFIACVLQNGFSAFIVVLAIVHAALAYSLYFDMFRFSERNGRELDQLIRETASMMTR